MKELFLFKENRQPLTYYVYILRIKPNEAMIYKKITGKIDKQSILPVTIYSFRAFSEYP